LAPFMVVSGDHARNDLAGDREDSWKSIFLKKGFEVETVLCGIGEWEEVQELFAAHAGLCLN
ncbi:MAG: sirohydrochlorin cobaltochelatase, partial [Eubacteriales bacterium]|nr:sirohydrochlorin cobaltochelatase [Eubacteriales bacterium]